MRTLRPCNIAYSTEAMRKGVSDKAGTISMTLSGHVIVFQFPIFDKVSKGSHGAFDGKRDGSQTHSWPLSVPVSVVYEQTKKARSTWWLHRARTTASWENI